jgi:hypothetical protein
MFVRIEMPWDAKKGQVFEAVWCPRCRKWMKPDEFHADASRASGRQGYCKTCQELARGGAE